MVRQKLGIALVFLLSLCCTNLFAQERTLNGVVVDETTGEHLPGAIVSTKGKPSNVSSRADGTFTIKLEAGDSILVVSYVGYNRVQMPVGNQEFVTVKMTSAEAKQLNDVVVVGYGTQSKRDITGAISTIDFKQIEDVPAASVSELLRGQVPGLNVTGGATRPGDLASISVRQQFNWGKDGGGTIPLVVIDDVIQVDPATGLPTLDRFNQLDLSEIESITVLKDASAAIYGSRASQGVIVVKTKRGHAGPPKINYSGKFETNDAVSHSKVMNARQFGEFSNSYFRAKGNTEPQYLFSDDELNEMSGLDYDWLAHDWRGANAMQHSLDVSGGSDKATYFTGASYYKQGANLGSQDFDRWTYRAGTNIKLMSGLNLGATVAASNTNIEKSFTKVNFQDGFASGGEQNDYSALLHMPKYIPWEYEIGGQMQYVSPPNSPGNPGRPSGNGQRSMWNYYALLNNGSKTTNKQFNYNVNFSLQYDVPWVPGLNFKFNYGLSQQSANTEQVMLPQVYYVNDDIKTANHHLFSEVDPANWEQVVNTTGNRVSYRNLTAKNEQFNFFAAYDHSFGDHNISAMVSAEKGQTEAESRVQLYEKTPSYYNGSSASAGTINTSNSVTNRSTTANLSYLGRASYNYKHKYLLNFVFRTEASTAFAPENYWGFFPGLSAGWVASDENFFKDHISWMDYLKLRVSIGRTGNNNIKPWKWLQVYNVYADKGFGFGNEGGQFVLGATPGVSPNRDVRWDRTTQHNIGLDLGFLDNRLTFTIDQYINITRDALTDMSQALGTPISVGGAFAEQNYADIKAWGTEISANWHDQVGDFKYSIGVNTSFNNYKTLKYYDLVFNYPSETTTRRAQGNKGITPVWGFQTWNQTSGGDGLLRTDADIDAYWNYLTQNAANSGDPNAAPNFMGITDKAQMKKGMLAFEDVAGNLDDENKTVGGPNGRIMKTEDFVKLKKSNRSYGLNTNINLSWRNFNLTTQIATSWGGSRFLDLVKQSSSSSASFWAQPIFLTDMYDELTNPEGKYPNMYYYDNFGGSQSNFFMLPTFRMYVRNLSIGYTLPKKWIEAAKLTNARLFLSGNNLWDFYNPYPKKFRNMYDASDVGYPTLRTWSLGVNVGF